MLNIPNISADANKAVEALFRSSAHEVRIGHVAVGDETLRRAAERTIEDILGSRKNPVNVTILDDDLDGFVTFVMEPMTDYFQGTVAGYAELTDFDGNFRNCEIRVRTPEGALDPRQTTVAPVSPTPVVG